ncbi:MAG: endo-1,4-beta-xylanase [Blastocatellia bacterium]
MNISASRFRAPARLPLFFFLLQMLISGVYAQSGLSLLQDRHQLLSHGGAGASVEPVAAPGQSFRQALRVFVSHGAARLDDVRLQWPVTQSIAAGDNLTLRFQVRKIAPLNAANIRGLVTLTTADGLETGPGTPFPCDSDVWTPYIIPFRAAHNLAAGQAFLSFHLGYGPQTLEIADVSLENAGPAGPPVENGEAIMPPLQSYYSYFDPQQGGSVSVVSVTGQPFTQALRMTANGAADFIYRSGVGWTINTSIQKDDVLWLSFRARLLDAPGGGILRALAVFEKSTPDYDKSAVVSLPCDNAEWRLFQIPFRSIASYRPTETHLVFQFSAGRQTFEVADISLLNYGKRVNPAQLPANSYYPGRGDLTAPWRAAAAQRIEQHRKGNLWIEARDEAGNPLPEAQVYVNQLDHAYKFGSAVTAARLTGAGPDNEIYRSRVSSHFNTTVFENDLKWGQWECVNCAGFRQDATRQAIAWLGSQRISVRGHNLVWPSWQYLPGDLRALGPDALRQRIDQRFADVLGDPGVNGRLYHWDVLNEPYTNYDLQGRIGAAGVPQLHNILGNQEMIRWFQLARRLDPLTKLYLNDYDILEADGSATQHQEYYLELARWLLANGAPLDGVGIQGHFASPTPVSVMQSILDRYAEISLPLAITEYDFNTPDEQLQADFTRDFLTLMFSTPQCADFLMWGFWERAHWLPAGAMYRADWSSKPAALAWNDLLFREWWTDESGTTDAQGRFQVRGFKGTYQVTVCHGRAVQTVTTALDDSGAVTVTLNINNVPGRGAAPGRGTQPGRRAGI